MSPTPPCCKSSPGWIKEYVGNLNFWNNYKIEDLHFTQKIENKDAIINAEIEVESLINKELTIGSHSIDWNASEHASGMYIYQLQSIDNSVSQKMVLMK